MSKARDKANIPSLNFSSTGIDDNATSTAITIDSSQNVSFNDDTGNTQKLIWNATDESLRLKVSPSTYGDYYVAYPVPRIGSGTITTDVVLIIGEKDVNVLRIQGRFHTPNVPNINDNRNAFIVDIIYQQWNGQLPRFSYDAIHTGSRAQTADNMELGEAVYDGTTYYAIKIQANTSALGGQPIYFTGGITNTTDLGYLPESALTSFTAVIPSSNDSSDKRISAENIRFKNEKNEDKMLITSGGDISFYEDTGTTPQFFWDASTERLGIGTTTPQNKLDISAATWDDGILIKNTGNFNVGIFGDANRTSAGGGLLNLAAKWNGKEVAGILFQAGLDTTNKDDGDILFRTSSANNISERMRITSGGQVLVAGTTAGDSISEIIVDNGATTSTYGFRHQGGGRYMRMGCPNSAYAYWETNTTAGFFIDGNTFVNGTLSKSSGSFKISHPLPEKTNTHNLVHSFVESPQADNIYRGKIDLVNGTTTVNIDTIAGMSEGTFVLLNREIQCFTSNETGWTAVKGSVSGNTLTITAQDNTCTDTISWMVIGERQDQHMYDTNWTDENGKVIVEPLKETDLPTTP
jgi:hypothetical protein